ncbi:MAG: hypothetical protein GDA53_11900 [Rhodobacteraceae bacterium]|nr:hypothetical protein [Paracoccaceae bacterium]
MRAIVHIGMPKAGSSSIQAWLQRNQAALAKQGFVYDRLAAPGAEHFTAQAELAVCVHDRLGEQARARGFRSAIGVLDEASQRAFAQSHTARFRASVRAAQGRVYVISAEHFAGSLRTREKITALAQFLSEFFQEVRYVLYLRRQEHYVPSAYSQTIRRGKNASLQDTMRRVIMNDYFKMVGQWAAAVGPDALEVRLLEPDALIDGDLLADFAAVLGVDQAGFTIPEHMNKSLSRAALEILCAYNARHPAFLENGRTNPAVDLFKKLLYRLDRDRTYEKPMLTHRQVRMVRSACADGNERLRAAWFPDRAELFPELPPPARVSGAMVSRQITELFVALYETPSPVTPRIPAPAARRVARLRRFLRFRRKG